MKIGELVYKNIKYEYYCFTKYLTPLDIYKKKTGVYADFTRLSNALLFSLGYQVVYFGGYCSENNIFRNDGHTWSLIKIGSMWYRFDSTWGLFKGKVPITHIFEKVDSLCFDNLGRGAYSPEFIISNRKETLQGKYIE